MSCGCEDGNAYQGVCNADTPYPMVSPESVPSLMANLVYALYGEVQKEVSSGVVKWIIPCDPNNTASLTTIPRNKGEGLLCYLLRVFSAAAVPVVSTSRTSGFTLALTDANSIIPVLSTSVLALTIVFIPKNSSVALPVGTQIMFQQAGAGQIVFSPAVGVTVRSSNSRTKTNTAYSMATLIKMDTDTWALTGDLA